ncbi:MAG: hypothetical protein ACRDRI_20075 [Pseudonocardiaceae bacterium]
MRLVKIAGECKDDDCPTVFTTDRGTVAVQGYMVDRVSPDGEVVVEIPAALLLEAARALGD